MTSKEILFQRELADAKKELAGYQELILNGCSETTKIVRNKMGVI